MIYYEIKEHVHNSGKWFIYTPLKEKMESFLP